MLCKERIKAFWSQLKIWDSNKTETKHFRHYVYIELSEYFGEYYPCTFFALHCIEIWYNTCSRYSWKQFLPCWRLKNWSMMWASPNASEEYVETVWFSLGVYFLGIIVSYRNKYLSSDLAILDHIGPIGTLVT